VQGEPAVRHCVRQMMHAGLETIVVVLGSNRAQIRRVLEDLPVDTAINDRAQSHMAESVSCGLAKMPGAVTGIMVALCDHPLVTPSTYAALNTLHQELPEKILLPVYDGRGGHPTVFPRSLCSAVDQGTPLNRVVRGHPQLVCRVPVDDPGVAYDMDTPADYRRMLSKNCPA